MKIAFLTDDIFSNGGVQRVVTTVSNLLSETYEVDVICTNKNINIDRQKYGLSQNVRVIHNPIYNSNKLNRHMVKFIRGVNRLTNILNNKYLVDILQKSYYSKELKIKSIDIINENKYDVVVGCEGFYAILLGIIKPNLQCKTIGWSHNSYEAYLENKNRYYWKRDILFKKYMAILDKNIVLTKSDKNKYLDELGIKSDVIYNPLSFRCCEKSELKSNVIIGAGRLSAQKGFDNLIKSFYIANKDRSDKWELWIIGDGEDEGILKKLVDSLNISNCVKFIPFTKEIDTYLKQASIYAMSSRWEGFGLVVTEALEAGLPVVSFNESGPKEILDGFNCATIVDQGGIVQFAKALIELMDNYSIRKEYSYNGLKRVKVFYGENIVNEWINIFS
ncbi:glycosyltransferase family 4 protein [Terrisporobacter petrolearius]|uniref:glycosyltransferase family 4 protein n=1 Tax=Terrisporobacter petrolearius TaxID=1460447 RepID=UPI001D16EF6C|nr:glycosyltransferase family 4 protein [Terrisporobacter petrolearius]MCC3862738.1 glycosyltransferase family 4 protein [Terrisporobacter petrolearius]